MKYLSASALNAMDEDRRNVAEADEDWKRKIEDFLNGGSAEHRRKEELLGEA